MFPCRLLVPLLGSVLFAGAIAGDKVNGYGEVEPALINASVPVGLTEADLQVLPLDAPLLRAAYAEMFISGGGPLRIDARRPEMLATMNDLKRRSDSATPLLLDMMDRNRNTDLEDSIPSFLSMLGKFNMEPYLDYMRRVVVTRPTEINASAAETFAALFAVYGKDDDVMRMQELAIQRPYLASPIKRALQTQKWKPHATRPSDHNNPEQVGPATTEQKNIGQAGFNNRPIQAATQSPETVVRQDSVSAGDDMPPKQRGKELDLTRWKMWVVGFFVMIAILGFIVASHLLNQRNT